VPAGIEPPPDGRVILGIRPEAFEDAAFADPALPVLDVEVAVVEELGSDTHVIFPVEAPRVDSDEVRETQEEEEELILAGDRAVFNARVDARSRARVGDGLRLALDPGHFHYFDPRTGANLGLAVTKNGAKAEATAG
jgi:multiple sugar transport system ATP-binding protein